MLAPETEMPAPAGDGVLPANARPDRRDQGRGGRTRNAAAPVVVRGGVGAGVGVPPEEPFRGRGRPRRAATCSSPSSAGRGWPRRSPPSTSANACAQCDNVGVWSCRCGYVGQLGRRLLVWWRRSRRRRRPSGTSRARRSSRQRCRRLLVPPRLRRPVRTSLARSR
jgi:hypothetical protein